MKILQKGRTTTAEIADFFGVSKNAFLKSKEKYLSLLDIYCQYEVDKTDKGYTRGYNILAVHAEVPFDPDNTERKRIQEFAKKDWGKYDPQGTADSLSIVANRYCAQHDIPYLLDKYIFEDDVYTNSKGKVIIKPKRVHNPEMKKWWYVYNIMASYYSKNKMAGNRIWLEVDSQKLAAYRITEEQQEIVNQLSKKYFGQKYMDSREAQELKNEIEEMIAEGNEQITMEMIYEKHPYLREINKPDKWNAFIEACKKAGVYEVIKGSDRCRKKEEEDIKPEEKKKGGK